MEITTQDNHLNTGKSNRPVLVAIDFSEHSRATLFWACQFATCSSSQLILLHVIHDSPSNPGFYLEDKGQPVQSMSLVAEQRLKKFLQDCIIERPELAALQTAKIQLSEGLPAGRIVELADQCDAALTVVGSRGLSGVSQALLGSVAERVVHLSRRAVAVIKPESQE